MVSPGKSMDFLSRLLDAVATHLQIPREHLDAIDQQTRSDEGGDRHYIASITALECQTRAKRVVALALSGVGSAQIAERTGISQRRVNQILAASSGKDAP